MFSAEGSLDTAVISESGYRAISDSSQASLGYRNKNEAGFKSVSSLNVPFIDVTFHCRIRTCTSSTTDIVMVQCYEKEMITNAIIVSLAYDKELCIPSIAVLLMETLLTSNQVAQLKDLMAR